jgi:hypothetical protein
VDPCRRCGYLMDQGTLICPVCRSTVTRTGSLTRTVQARVALTLFVVLLFAVVWFGVRALMN